MGTFANFNGKRTYLKITRIWGSKSEGWNAWILPCESKVNPVGVDTPFHLQAPYVENQNPFKLLYELLDSVPFLTEIEHDVNIPPSIEEVAKNIGQSFSAEPTPPVVKVKKSPGRPKK